MRSIRVVGHSESKLTHNLAGISCAAAIRLPFTGPSLAAVASSIDLRTA